MPLALGVQIGPYEVLSLLGSGGMGEVYRAKDTKLNRDVALKVLPQAFTLDPDRLARFRREAQVLASLNHPHIGAIYGIEESNGTNALVLELVDGPTVADRIAQGPLLLDEALSIAKQVAEALEAAHEQGIIHRDLKPANIKVRPDGMVKVLDFGLAKALAPEGARTAPPDLSHSPTITSPAMTRLGVIMGTAAYMAPEQARGKPVDKRTDIWAFGCVLYEMLTGKRAFEGEDVPDVMARIVQGEPTWERLPADTPDNVRHVLFRCLTKDPARRLRDIGDGRIDLEGARHRQSAPERTSRASARLGWSVAAVVIVIWAVTSVFGWRPTRSNSGNVSSSASTRFLVSAPQGWHIMEGPIAQEIAISPDNQRIAFTVASDTGATWGVAVRPLDAVDAELVPGTEGGRAPFWSPDSRHLGFFNGGKLKRIEISTGAIQTIGEVANIGKATWGTSGITLVDVENQNLYSVPASGGRAEAVTTLDSQFRAYPHFLPDGRHFFYSTFGSSEGMRTNIGTLGSKEVLPLLTSDSGVQYAAGHVFFVQVEKLMTQAFDAGKLQLIGDAVPLTQPVWINPMGHYPGFAVSAGLVAFGTGNVPQTQLVWLDRTGKEVGVVGTPDRYLGVSISPGGTEAALPRFDPKSRSFDIWIINLASGRPSRLTFDPLIEDLPVWSPKGESLAFNQNGSSVVTKPASGARPGETVWKQDMGYIFPQSWSMDGRYLAYTTRMVEGGDIGVIPMSGDKKPVVILHEPFDHSDPKISPNSKWIAYASSESGRYEINVVSFPKPEGKWQVSATGGTRPRWRPDGKELFFLSSSGQLMAVDVTGDGSVFQKGVPRILFDIPGPRVQGWFYNYDVAMNGQQFLFNRVTQSSEPPRIMVITNWQSVVSE